MHDVVDHDVVDPDSVLNCGDKYQHSLQKLLSPYGIEIKMLADQVTIPGSFFGEREAGLIGNQLLIRSDTPIHSALHESGHFICMDNKRRNALDTDAAGDYDEENGVCYLQILLSEFLPEMGKFRMMQDMDSWGYSFRLGTAQAWFERDAEDAFAWLLKYQIIDVQGQLTWRLRD